MQEPEQVAAREPGPASPAEPIQQLEVATLYSSNCAACHGVDGTGKQIRPGMPTIPDFTSLAWQMSQTDVEIAHRIIDGNQPLMPAFRDKLTRPQNLALTIYVRAFAITPVALAPQPAPGAKPPPAPPEAITANMPPAQVYRAYCLACHDPDGRGSTIRKSKMAGEQDFPDFAAAPWQAKRSNADLRHSILEGKGKFMLPMKDKLGAADVDQLIAYVRAFQGGKQLVQVRPEELHLKPVPDRPVVVVPPSSRPPAGPPLQPGPQAADESPARTRVATFLYRQYCLTCHGATGKGTEMRASMPALPDFTSSAWQESRTNAALAASILDGKGQLMPAFRGRVGETRTQDLIAYVRAFGHVPARGEPTKQATDFEERFRQLQQQWDALEKQLQELQRPD